MSNQNTTKDAQGFTITPRIAIPEPAESTESMRDTLVALKQAVEQMTRQRGPNIQSHVSWQQLVDLGLVATTQVPR